MDVLDKKNQSNTMGDCPQVYCTQCCRRVQMNINRLLRDPSGPRPLCRVADTAKLGYWHPSIMDIHVLGILSPTYHERRTKGRPTAKTSHSFLTERYVRTCLQYLRIDRPDRQFTLPVVSRDFNDELAVRVSRPSLISTAPGRRRPVSIPLAMTTTTAMSDTK